jgi:hypothetical protein
MILIRIAVSIVRTVLERKVFLKVFCEVSTISNLGIPLCKFEKSHEKTPASKFVFILNK